MLPDRVSNPGPLTYESGALPIALRGPASVIVFPLFRFFKTCIGVWVHVPLKFALKGGSSGCMFIITLRF